MTHNLYSFITVEFIIKYFSNIYLINGNNAITIIQLIGNSWSNPDDKNNYKPILFEMLDRKLGNKNIHRFEDAVSKYNLEELSQLYTNLLKDKYEKQSYTYQYTGGRVEYIW